MFAWGDALVAGYGPRTEELALKHLATDLQVRVRGVRITHPAMYHLDLAFCPLDGRRAMVAPGAFDDASVSALLALVPEPLILTDEEALTTFCANSTRHSTSSPVFSTCARQMRSACLSEKLADGTTTTVARPRSTCRKSDQPSDFRKQRRPDFNGLGVV